MTVPDELLRAEITRLRRELTDYNLMLHGAENTRTQGVGALVVVVLAVLACVWWLPAWLTATVTVSVALLFGRSIGDPSRRYLAAKQGIADSLSTLAQEFPE